MPWKQNYTISNEKTVLDADLGWPAGMRCCFSVTVDLSVAVGPAGIRPQDIGTPEAFFALNDGLEQILRALRRHSLKATIAVPAAIASLWPDVVETVLKDGHEIAANGFRHEDVTNLPREDEAARIAAATEILTQAAGRRPTGWYSLPRPQDPFAGGTISANTMDLLIDAGYTWFGNGLADDIPHYWVTDFAMRRAILALPYYYHFDDQFFLMFPAKGTGLEHADSLFRNWRAEFAAQYARGRHFHMVVHPRGSGFAHRAELLDRFLAEVVAMPGLWNPTGSECADWWMLTYPQGTHLAEGSPHALEDSIWRDYPGSLS
jgi:peptidoglycan/xylan/chitin deacetylase (PgdA/CDA1 family)